MNTFKSFALLENRAQVSVLYTENTKEPLSIMECYDEYYNSIMEAEIEFERAYCKGLVAMDEDTTVLNEGIIAGIIEFIQSIITGIIDFFSSLFGGGGGSSSSGGSSTSSEVKTTKLYYEKFVKAKDKYVKTIQPNFNVDVTVDGKVLKTSYNTFEPENFINLKQGVAIEFKDETDQLLQFVNKISSMVDRANLGGTPPEEDIKALEDEVNQASDVYSNYSNNASTRVEYMGSVKLKDYLDTMTEKLSSPEIKTFSEKDPSGDIPDNFKEIIDSLNGLLETCKKSDGRVSAEVTDTVKKALASVSSYTTKLISQYSTVIKERYKWVLTELTSYVKAVNSFSTSDTGVVSTNLIEEAAILSLYETNRLIKETQSLLNEDLTTLYENPFDDLDDFFNESQTMVLNEGLSFVAIKSALGLAVLFISLIFLAVKSIFGGRKSSSGGGGYSGGGGSRNNSHYKVQPPPNVIKRTTGKQLQDRADRAYDDFNDDVTKEADKFIKECESYYNAHANELTDKVMKQFDMKGTKLEGAAKGLQERFLKVSRIFAKRFNFIVSNVDDDYYFDTKKIDIVCAKVDSDKLGSKEIYRYINIPIDQVDKVLPSNRYINYQDQIEPFFKGVDEAKVNIEQIYQQILAASKKSTEEFNNVIAAAGTSIATSVELLNSAADEAIKLGEDIDSYKPEGRGEDIALITYLNDERKKFESSNIESYNRADGIIDEISKKLDEFDKAINLDEFVEKFDLTYNLLNKDGTLPNGEKVNLHDFDKYVRIVLLNPMKNLQNAYNRLGNFYMGFLRYFITINYSIKEDMREFIHTIKGIYSDNYDNLHFKEDPDDAEKERKSDNPDSEDESTNESVLLNSSSLHSIKVEQLVAEAVIFSENITDQERYDKLTSLNEAIVRKIQEWWKAGIAKIKALFAKFMEKMNRVTDANYLKKYKNIILKQPFQNRSYKSKDLFGCMNRTLSLQVPYLDYNKHADILKGENPISTFFQRELAPKMQGYAFFKPNNTGAPNTIEQLANYCKDWFMGTQEVEFNGAAVQEHIKDVYDYLMDMKKIKQSIDKSINDIEKSAANVAKIGGTGQAAKQNAEYSATGNAANDAKTTGDNGTGGQDGTPTPAQVATGESANFDFTNSVYSILYELEVQNPAQQNQQPASGTNANPSASGVRHVEDGTNVDQSAAKDSMLNDVEKVCKNYVDICTTVLKAKLTAIEFTRKELREIVRIHVQDYIGKQDIGKGGEEATNTQQYQNTIANNQV